MKMKLTKDPSHKGYYKDENGNLYVFRFGGRPIKVDGYREDKPREDVQVEEVSVEKSDVIDHSETATKEDDKKFNDGVIKDEVNLMYERLQSDAGMTKEETLQFLQDAVNDPIGEDGILQNDTFYDNLDMNDSEVEAQVIKTAKERVDELVKENSSTPEKEPILKYSKEFTMMSPVNDFSAANEYLSEDDMKEYLPENLKDKISKVEWKLDDESSGHVEIEAVDELSYDDMIELENWIDGQNSDGLGEGFEQQEFAESYYDPYSGDGPYTRYEAEEEISRRIDEMDPEDYWNYIDESEIEAGVDNYIEYNGLEYTEDEDIRQGYKSEMMDDPFSYIDDNAIYDARDRAAMDNPDYNVDEWYNMSSMRSNSKGFEIEDIVKEEPKKVAYTSQELKDKYGTDDVDIINAGKAAEDRVMKVEEGDIRSKLLKGESEDKSFIIDKDIPDEPVNSPARIVKDTDYWNWVDSVDPNGNLSDKELEDIYRSTHPSNIESSLKTRYAGTIKTLEAEHPNWSMAKIMEKIRKLDAED